jgi:hypothetical protein
MVLVQCSVPLKQHCAAAIMPSTSATLQRKKEISVFAFGVS